MSNSMSAATSLESSFSSPGPGPSPEKKSSLTERTVSSVGKHEISIRHSSRKFSCTKRAGKFCGIFALLVAISTIIALFSIPIIFNFFEIQIHKNSTSVNMTNSTNCSAFAGTWERVTEPVCSGVSYTGSECNSLLNLWQECASQSASENSRAIMVINRNNSTMEEIENSVSNIKMLLLLLTTDDSQCYNSAVPFICQYAYPLCEQSTGATLLPSQEQCMKISEQLCRSEWRSAMAIPSIASMLPDCSSLPSVASGSGSGQSPAHNTTGDLNCRPDFIMINSSCQPRCYGWEQSSHEETVTVIVIELFAAALGLTVGIVVIVSSIIRRKTMLKFPSIFLIYITIGFCIVALFVLIPSVNPGFFFCSNDNLLTSLNNPTTFCTITGAVLQYFIVNMSLWWFFHVIAIFCKVLFPVRARQWENQKRFKYFHMAALIIGIILPVPAVAVTLATDGYSITRFPPLLCAPQNSKAWYYSAVLVMNVLLAVGACLLLITFWKVHKYQGIFRIKSNKREWRISTPEKKLLFILSYYVIFGVITLAYFSVSTHDQDAFLEAALRYFICEEPGNNPSCSRNDFEQYTYPFFAASSYLLMGLIPVSILIYTINWSVTSSRLNLLCQKRCRCCSHSHKIKNADDNYCTGTSIG